MTAVTPVTAEGPAGFDAFVAGQSRTLLRSAWLLTGEWTEAEDLVQTALAVTWQRWGALDAPTAYTRRVMMTTFLRWRGRRWTGEVATEEVPEDPDLTDETDRADLRASLVAALQSLPGRQRAVVVLRYFADLTEPQTADALGCSVGAVKAHASRAMVRLREHPGIRALLEEAPR